MEIKRKKFATFCSITTIKARMLHRLEKICAIYGEDTLSKSAARKWFARFRAGNFDVKDKPCSGRPI